MLLSDLNVLLERNVILNWKGKGSKTSVLFTLGPLWIVCGYPCLFCDNLALRKGTANIQVIHICTHVPLLLVTFSRSPWGKQPLSKHLCLPYTSQFLAAFSGKKLRQKFCLVHQSSTFKKAETLDQGCCTPWCC